MTAWLDHAWAELGELEVSGSAANPKIIGYFRDTQRSDILSDEIPWCAALTGACLMKAGISIAAIPPSLRLLARSYLKIGTELKEPRIGAICVLTRGSSKSAGHVGFVVGWTATHVVLLGGNQANAVTVAHFNKGRVLGYRWPETVSVPEIANTSRIAQAAKRQQKDIAKGGGTQVAPAPPSFETAVTPAVAAPAPVADVAVPVTPPIDALPSPEAVMGKATLLQSSVDTAMNFSTFLNGKWPWVVGVVGLYYAARVIWNSHLIRQWRTQDAATGKTPSAIERTPIEPGAMDFAEGET